MKNPWKTLCECGHEGVDHMEWGTCYPCLVEKGVAGCQKWKPPVANASHPQSAEYQPCRPRSREG